MKRNPQFFEMSALVLASLLLLVISNDGFKPSLENEAMTLPVTSITVPSSKYEIGDKVRCSQWENSYWEGKVINIIKNVIYQIELSEIHVDGELKLYLNPSECTGKKRLSFEDGVNYNQTKIWVHERCLN